MRYYLHGVRLPYWAIWAVLTVGTWVGTKHLWHVDVETGR